MKAKNILMVVIPSMFSWCLAALLLLVYSFDILEYVDSLENNPLKGYGPVLLLILLILIFLVMYFTGQILDSKPKFLGNGVTLGMLGSSVSAILFSFIKDEVLLFLGCLFVFAFFFAILLTSSGALFAGISDMRSRGKIYSIAMFGFISLTLVSIIIGTGWDVILPAIGFLGLILTLIFYFLARDLGTPWVPDAWPTKFRKIVGRRSVQAYLTTHFLLYCMLGISIAIFPAIGSLLAVADEYSIPILGQIQISVAIVFWIVVLIGDLLLVIPAGVISDRIGRKNLIVLAIYGIVFSIVIIGLEQSAMSFIVAALIIGFSFAFIHPTLDSSLWADLSPRDGLGRYFAFGFMSLALGLGAGYVVGHWIIIPSFNILDSLDIITYFLMILAVIAAFPLFWTSDSYKPLDFTLLMAIEEGGLPLFDYDFQKTMDTDIELTLLSGALTAVSSFMNETLRERGVLNLVRHGNHFIITDKDESTGISTVIFSNKQDPELKQALREFQTRFVKEYGQFLKTWNGARDVFDGAVDIAEEVFGHLAPSTNLED